MRRRRARTAPLRAGAAALLLCSSCYSYAPADLGGVRSGDAVRIHLSRQGMIDLPEIPGSSGPTLSGSFLSIDEGQLLLRVPLDEQTGGLLTQRLGKDVLIGASEVVQLERRELDRFRTGLAVAGGLLGAVAVLAGFDGLSAPTPEAPAEPIDEEAGVGGLRAILRLSLPMP